MSFVIVDKLLGDFHGKGVLVQNIYGRLWRIKPQRHKRLSGKTLTLHEDSIGDSDMLNDVEKMNQDIDDEIEEYTNAN